MTKLRQLDAWFIQRLEARCHRFQRWTGKTNFWLGAQAARMIVLILFGELLLGAFGKTHGYALWGDLKPNTGLAALNFLVLLGYGIEGFWDWREREAEAYRRVERGLANPQKIHRVDVAIRTYMAVISAAGSPAGVLLGHWDAVVMSLLMTFWFYLVACDPLPPCRAKFSLRSLFTVLAPQPMESR